NVSRKKRCFHIFVPFIMLPKFPMALIVGNEVKGIQNMSHNLVDACIEIPMRGKKESLNVAVALGIALYELTRRWE
ncbi:MAG: TrmH family RNA methyltransferase, partial [Patescibacteria group bacterium]